MRVEVEGKIEKIVKGIIEVYGGLYIYMYWYGYDLVINDEYIMKIVEESVLYLFGNECVVKFEFFMGGEDFLVYLRKVFGCFIKLGIGNENIYICYLYYYLKFDVDELVLICGVEIFLEMIIRLLKL